MSQFKWSCRRSSLLLSLFVLFRLFIDSVVMIFRFDHKNKGKKNKNKQVGVHQTKKFYTAKETINKMKRHPKIWGKIFANRISAKGIIYTLIREGNLLSLWIQVLISFRDTLTDTPRLMFGQMSGHPVAQSSEHIKLTITFGFFLTKIYHNIILIDFH